MRSQLGAVVAAVVAALVFAATPGMVAHRVPPEATESGAAAETDCGHVLVPASLVDPEDPGTGRQRGRISIRYRDPGTAVSLLSPYYGSAHSDIHVILNPHLSSRGSVIPRPLVFLQGSRSARTGDGFLQELTLDWLGDLELEVAAPGCPAVTVRCSARRCAG